MSELSSGPPSAPMPSLRRALVAASMIWLLSGNGGFAMSGTMAAHRARPRHALVAAPSRDPLPPRRRLLRLFLVRNLSVAALLIAGLATLGLSAVVGGATNGWALGMTVGSTLAAGATPTALALVLLPHGVFEIAGLVIACAIGLNGFAIGLRLARDGAVSFSLVLERYGRAASVAVALIAFAALIESSITPLLGAFL